MECKNNTEVYCSASNEEAKSKRLQSYFRTATLTTVDKFLSSFSFNMFKVFYPEIYTKYPSHLKGVHQQLIAQLKTPISEDIDGLCQERRVYPSLQNLDTVIDQYKDKSQDEAWRPSGCPEDDIRDHIYEMKLKHKRRLQELLEEMKTENKLLEDTMLENDKMIRNIKKEIDDHNVQINEHFECIQGSNVNILEEELRNMCEMQ